MADAHFLAQIPPNVSFEGASTIPLGFATAAVGLYQDFRAHGGIGLVAPWDEGGYKKYTGQPIVVIGGASSVGQFGSFYYNTAHPYFVLKLSHSDPATGGLWLQPHHHHGLEAQRGILQGCRRDARHRLPRRAIL
jgi:hypothetical protein